MGLVLELANRVTELVASKLEDRGFRRDKTKTWAIDVSSEVVGAVALSRVMRGEGFELSPIVHLRHRSVESLLRRSLGVKLAAPAIAANIGYLSPIARCKTWSLEHQDDSGFAGKVGDVVQSIDEWAIPFMNRHTTLAAVWDTIESKGHCSAPEFVIPAVHMLLGRREAAIQFTDAELARRRGTASFEIYRAFSVAVLQ
jgi:hypothetical protein